jgi:hypothetical protein
MSPIFGGMRFMKDSFILWICVGVPYPMGRINLNVWCSEGAVSKRKFLIEYVDTKRWTERQLTEWDGNVSQVIITMKTSRNFRHRTSQCRSRRIIHFRPKIAREMCLNLRF